MEADDVVKANPAEYVLRMNVNRISMLTGELAVFQVEVEPLVILESPGTLASSELQDPRGLQDPQV